MTRSATEAREIAHPGDFLPRDDYFDAGLAPFGGDGVGLSIGPLRMRLEGLSKAQAERLRVRYAPFVDQSTGPGDLTIALRRAGVGTFLRLSDAPGSETYRLGSRSAGDRLTLWSYEFAGWVEPRRRQALLALVEEDGPLCDRGLENFLRIMTASFILERGGFLLHSSGVVRDGRAYVFFGPSGAGKTTVTRLSPGDTILSDDLNLVIPVDDAYRACGIPFGQAHHRVPATSGAFPIASLNRLVQSPRVGREKIAGARAVAEVASCLPFVMQETGQAARAMETVARALRTIPVFRLEFRKDDAFWDVVEER